MAAPRSPLGQLLRFAMVGGGGQGELPSLPTANLRACVHADNQDDKYDIFDKILVDICSRRRMSSRE